MSDPEKSYHFEIVCAAEAMAVQVRDLICSFEMDAKIVQRKKAYVVYLKEGSQIVDILNVKEHTYPCGTGKCPDLKRDAKYGEP